MLQAAHRIRCQTEKLALASHALGKNVQVQQTGFKRNASAIARFNLSTVQRVRSPTKILAHACHALSKLVQEEPCGIKRHAVVTARSLKNCVPRLVSFSFQMNAFAMYALLKTVQAISTCSMRVDAHASASLILEVAHRIRCQTEKLAHASHALRKNVQVKACGFKINAPVTAHSPQIRALQSVKSSTL